MAMNFDPNMLMTMMNLMRGNSTQNNANSVDNNNTSNGFSLDKILPLLLAGQKGISPDMLMNMLPADEKTKSILAMFQAMNGGGSMQNSAQKTASNETSGGQNDMQNGDGYRGDRYSGDKRYDQYDNCGGHDVSGEYDSERYYDDFYRTNNVKAASHGSGKRSFSEVRNIGGNEINLCLFKLFDSQKQ